MGTNFSQDFIKRNYKYIIDSSDISYLKDKSFVFDLNRTVVNSEFYVDHKEILEFIRKEKNWKLGNIMDGEEFVVIVEQKEQSKAIIEAIIEAASNEGISIIVAIFLAIVQAYFKRKLRQFK